MLPVLRSLADGTQQSPGWVTERVAEDVGVTPEQQTEMLPSGKQTTYRNRIHWALHYLKRAGVLETPVRGRYRITERGRELLNEAPHEIRMKTLERYPEYIEFVSSSNDKPEHAQPVVDSDATPLERLESAYTELQAHVAAEILDQLRRMDPLRFERVVLEVLTAMGYGGSNPDRASLTPYSHDGGLDGVINEDELGLDRVVVQAKRYNQPVDVKYVREFAGSLDEYGTNIGVLFTTDKFTAPALLYVKSIPKRIVLVDGPELARLMVRHGIGVTVSKTLHVTRVDGDYFDVEADG
jgi:restriction system protein